MAAKSLKCPECERTFSMPAHVARHVNSAHSPQSRKKIAAKRARKSKAKRRVGRPKASAKKKVASPRKRAAAAAGAIDGTGARLIADMRNYHNALVAQRDALDGGIAGLATAMDAPGGATPAPAPARRKTKSPKRAAPARRGRRPSSKRGGRTGSLAEHVFRALKKSTKPLSPADLAAKVVAAGYSTKATDLAKAVSNALAKIKRVKRVGRGMYRL